MAWGTDLIPEWLSNDVGLPGTNGPEAVDDSLLIFTDGNLLAGQPAWPAEAGEVSLPQASDTTHLRLACDVLRYERMRLQSQRSAREV